MHRNSLYFLKQKHKGKYVTHNIFAFAKNCVSEQESNKMHGSLVKTSMFNASGIIACDGSELFEFILYRVFVKEETVCSLIDGTTAGIKDFEKMAPFCNLLSIHSRKNTEDIFFLSLFGDFREKNIVSEFIVKDQTAVALAGANAFLCFATALA